MFKKVWCVPKELNLGFERMTEGKNKTLPDPYGSRTLKETHGRKINNPERNQTRRVQHRSNEDPQSESHRNQGRTLVPKQHRPNPLRIQDKHK